MKKIIFGLAIFVGLTASVQSAKAQTAMTNPNGYTLDTASNTTAEGPTLQVKSFQETTSFCITLTKISGTVAGVTQLYGSNDGTNYAALGSSKTNTDVASQTWCFDDSPKHYLYYKVLITGAGTMSVSYSATHYATKK